MQCWCTLWHDLLLLAAWHATLDKSRRPRPYCGPVAVAYPPCTCLFCACQPLQAVLQRHGNRLPAGPHNFSQHHSVRSTVLQRMLEQFEQHDVVSGITGTACMRALTALSMRSWAGHGATLLLFSQLGAGLRATRLVTMHVLCHLLAGLPDPPSGQCLLFGAFIRYPPLPSLFLIAGGGRPLMEPALAAPKQPLRSFWPLGIRQALHTAELPVEWTAADLLWSPFEHC